MGGLRQRMPLTHLTFLASCLAMAGIAPLSGFFSKDEILWRALASANPSWPSWFSALIYGLGLAAAFCTALYLFRLYYLVFSGQPRGVAGAHESPVSMTMPLLVLAFGAAVAGLCGIPGDSPLSHGFEEWLAPVTHRATLAAQLLRTGALGENALAQSHGLEWTLMGVALALAIVTILLARRIYHGGRSPLLEKLTAVRPLPVLSRAAAGAYGVDTLYRWVVVRPVQIAARALWKAVDDFIIDLLAVRLIGAWLIDWAGRISRQLHNGSVQRYFAAMVTGLAVIVIWVSWTPSVSFEIDPGPSVRAGQVVTFSPRQPAEEAARGLEYQWDFGDQSPPSAWGPPQSVTHVYRTKSSYTVRLRVRDARWKTSASETRRVEVD
jgi:NADH-quinone oxidoreductase subunit L